MKYLAKKFSFKRIRQHFYFPATQLLQRAPSPPLLFPLLLHFVKLNNTKIFSTASFSLAPSPSSTPRQGPLRSSFFNLLKNSISSGILISFLPLPFLPLFPLSCVPFLFPPLFQVNSPASLPLPSSPPSPLPSPKPSLPLSSPSLPPLSSFFFLSNPSPFSPHFDWEFASLIRFSVSVL